MPRWIKIVLGVLISAVLVAGLSYGFRNSIATRALAYMLDHQEKLTCSHPEVEVASSLAWADVAPLDCKIRRSPMSEFKTMGPSRMFLKPFGVERIHVPRAVFDFHDRDVSHVQLDSDGELANVVKMTDPMVKGILDSSETYSPDQPPMLIDHLTMQRGGKRESVMHEHTTTMDGVWSRSHAERVDFGMEGIATVREFDMRVTPRRGKLRMLVHLGDAEPGEKPDALVKLDGSELDQPKPRFDLSLDTDVEGPKARAPGDAPNRSTALTKRR